MLKTYYLVGAVERSVGVETLGLAWPVKNTIPLIWADGMVGACPVFSNRRKAEKYAGKRFSVLILKAEVVK